MNNRQLCCLCGQPPTASDPITREHVPPKQFYPKKMRSGLNLWTVPAHQSCNEKSREDEEYFYHVAFLLVSAGNPQIGAAILADLKRRARNQQTRHLVRLIINESGRKAASRIILPNGRVRCLVSRPRLQHVAVKIARCLFYKDHGRVIPFEACYDVRLCEHIDRVPEYYRLSWGLSKVNVHELTSKSVSGVVVVNDAAAGLPPAVCRAVFDYRGAELVLDGVIHYPYTLRFWESFVYCVSFSEPADGVGAC